MVLILVLSTACAGRPSESRACTASTAPAGAETIGLTASADFTSALALVPAADRPGGAMIEWMPVYSVTNLTGARICVHDILMEFPRREGAGMLVWVESLGPSREVALYTDLGALRADSGRWTVPAQPLPFVLEAGATVMARLVQTYRFMVGGEELGLGPEDDLSEYVGPYLGLPQLGEDGRYHCATVFTGLTATVESSAGRSTHTVSQLLMPAGCVRVIPPR